MPRESSLEAKIRRRIKQGESSAYVYADFLDLSDRDQIGRVLRKMVKQNELIRFGQGIYVRTRKSEYTGKILPELDMRTLAEQALTKLNVRVFPSKAEIMYNSGKSTQIPTGRMIGVDKRISRKIGYNGYSIKYERAYA